jgi:hypothetical protein
MGIPDGSNTSGPDHHILAGSLLEEQGDAVSKVRSCFDFRLYILATLSCLSTVTQTVHRVSFVKVHNMACFNI